MNLGWTWEKKSQVLTLKSSFACFQVPSDIYSMVPKRCQRKIEELRVRAWTLGHKSRVLQMHQMQILSIWHKQYIFVHSEFAFNFPFYLCRFLRYLILKFLYLKGIHLKLKKRVFCSWWLLVQYHLRIQFSPRHDKTGKNTEKKFSYWAWSTLWVANLCDITSVS